MKSFYILIVIVMMASSIFCQIDNEMATYKNAKIILSNGKSKKANNLHFKNDTTLSFYTLNSQQEITLNISQIETLWAKKGNYALEYACIGGTIGLGTNLLALAMSNAEHGKNLPFKKALPIIGAFTFGTAGIGALIGWMCPKYTEITLTSKTKSTSLELVPIINNHECGIALVF